MQALRTGRSCATANKEIRHKFALVGEQLDNLLRQKDGECRRVSGFVTNIAAFVVELPNAKLTNPLLGGHTIQVARGTLASSGATNM
jgi:hypothetical protein